MTELWDDYRHQGAQVVNLAAYRAASQPAFRPRDIVLVDFGSGDSWSGRVMATPMKGSDKYLIVRLGLQTLQWIAGRRLIKP